MDGWMQIGDKKIPIEDVHINIDEYHEEFDYKRQEKIKVADKISFKQIRANSNHTCKKCKNLISILQEVNGEIMHCGYNCKKSSMRADNIKETKKCMLYQNI